MLTTLSILVGLVAYASAGAWCWGYIRGVIEDETGWNTPLPLLSALLWPAVLVVIAMRMLLIPIQAMGFSLQQKQMLQKKQRIELQNKTRIELEAAEKELLEEFQELEDWEQADKKLKKASRIPHGKVVERSVDRVAVAPEAKKTRPGDLGLPGDQ